MYDSITPEVLPAGADAYGAYTSGHWPTYSAVRKRFPTVRILAIAVNADEDGECLDVEAGDATVAQAPGWRNRQVARGLKVPPKFYASVSKLAELAATLTDSHIPRASYRLWSAHYSDNHICGPATCAYRDGAGRVTPAADGTQWTDRYQGLNIDASVLSPGFFDLVAPAGGGSSPQLEDDVYQGQIPPAGKVGVPVVLGTTDRACVFADFTTATNPLSVRVAVYSAAKGYSQIVTVALTDAKPHYVTFEEKDVAAVSFRRTDTADQPVGYFITG